jgi:hypothetical protein
MAVYRIERIGECVNVLTLVDGRWDAVATLNPHDLVYVSYSRYPLPVHSVPDHQLLVAVLTEHGALACGGVDG